MLEEITIVLPTRNEAANIPDFLGSLPPAVPLVVVDASVDETAVLIQTLRPHQTTIIRHPGNVTVARQIGAEVATTPWLLFTDADVAFHRRYFEIMANYRAHDAIYGPKRSRGEYGRYYQLFSRGQQLIHRLGIPAASGSNLLVRRDVFQKIGGFDLDLSVNEDSEIAWRLKRRGYDITFAPDLPVYEFDHRRLRNGRFRKTAHSLIRCALLFTGLMPQKWRQHDWGYWANARRGTQ